MAALAIAIPFVCGLMLFFAWLIWLALGVVLPVFGVACPGYWVVFCGWFLLCVIGKALKGDS